MITLYTSNRQRLDNGLSISRCRSKAKRQKIAVRRTAWKRRTDAKEKHGGVWSLVSHGERATTRCKIRTAAEAACSLMAPAMTTTMARL